MIEGILAAAGATFALTMGGSGMAPAFASALGARIVGRTRAALLFGAFVCLGAMLLGPGVARTLGSGLVGPGTLGPASAAVVLVAAAVSMLIANLLGVPQSTSWVTVASISVVGVASSSLRTDVILTRLLPAWVLLPAASFLVTKAAMRPFYPLRPSNFHRIEWITRNQRTLRALVLGSSCFVALAIGSNNVANVVAPLTASGLLDEQSAFALAAPLFAVGAVLFRAPCRTVGCAIVPLGSVTASVVNVVTGTCLLAASVLGIPQSLVQIMTASVIAVRWVKDGPEETAAHAPVRKVLLLWLISPVVAAVLTALLLSVPLNQAP